MQRSALCRSRRELSNAYFVAKFGFDTAENEPCKVCPLSAYRSPRLDKEHKKRKEHKKHKKHGEGAILMADGEHQEDHSHDQPHHHRHEPPSQGREGLLSADESNALFERIGGGATGRRPDHDTLQEYGEKLANKVGQKQHAP